jgi:Tfp pilus assembly protein PilW
MLNLRSQEGFTLAEVLSSILIGMIVLSTAGVVVVATMKINHRVGEKTGSSQMGRVAVEQIGQRFRSQTCLFAGEYRYNGSGSPASTRAAGIVHASPTKIIYITDIGNSTGSTGATDVVGFQPELRWLEVTGAVGPTSSATIVEGWTNSTGSRPYNFPITPLSSFDGLATVAGANSLTPANRRAIVDRVQTASGSTRVFTFYNDSGSQVAESGGAVPLSSLETITRVNIAFRVAGRSTNIVTSEQASQFVNDYYVRTITDRCEGA